MVELCGVFELAPLTKPPNRLARQGFAALGEELKINGLDWIDGDTAERLLQDFQSTYEPFLAALAAYLIINLPGVTGEEDGAGLDNWQRSAKGRAAKKLVEKARARD